MSRSAALAASAIAGLLLLSLLSLAVGRVWIDPLQLIGGSPNEQGSVARLIVWELRAPRLALSLAVGGALGLSGAVLQGLTRNPLAEPGLLGVSSGAAFGAVVAIYFGVATQLALAAPVAGLLGAAAATSLTFALGRGGGTIALILAGAAVTGLFAAGVDLALNLAPNPYAAYEIVTWLMGSLVDRSWEQATLAIPFMAGGAWLLAFCGRGVDALSLGEEQAQSLGVDLGRLRLLAIVGTAMAVGAATSVTGAIGFVGLIAPHLVRPLVKHQPSRTLLPSAVVGAGLLTAADVFTRLVPTGNELRLGVLTTLIGTPFFFWLVVRMRKTAP